MLPENLDVNEVEELYQRLFGHIYREYVEDNSYGLNSFRIVGDVKYVSGERRAIKLERLKPHKINYEFLLPNFGGHPWPYETTATMSLTPGSFSHIADGDKTNNIESVIDMFKQFGIYNSVINEKGYKGTLVFDERYPMGFAIKYEACTAGDTQVLQFMRDTLS